MTENQDQQAAEDVVKDASMAVPQPAWQTLDRLQLAVQVSQQQLQAFVDGLAMGQSVPAGAQLRQTQDGGWAWLPRE